MTWPSKLFVAAFAVLEQACSFTTDNAVTLSPLHTQHPVSASQGYIASSGEIVKPEQYDVLRSFELERKVEGPRHDSSSSLLDVGPEIDRLLVDSGGTAATNVRIEATDYEAGSHRSAATWKLLGVYLGGTAVALTAVGAGEHQGNAQTAALASGAGLFVTGVLCYLVSLITDKPSRWTFHVSGQTVRQREKPPIKAVLPSPASVESPSPPPPLAPAATTSETPGNIRPSPADGGGQ